MASELISVIGTAVTLFSFLTSQIPSGPNEAKISYVIANDGAHGSLTSAGGDMPDVRMWDETAEFLGANYDPGHCGEGYTTCTTKVNTQEAVTYTLFTGNTDAICIPWTGLSWAGGQKKYGFHPGNWAHACNSGAWYYAGQKVPGIDSVDDVFCAWVDKNGDVPTTAFQVHWPEFDGDESSRRGLDYYCNSKPPVAFYTGEDPNSIVHWTPTRDLVSGNTSTAMTPAIAKPEKKEQTVTGKQTRRRARGFEGDIRVIKSHYPKHLATELCDHSKKAAGPSFVSYEQEQFCYMPTKTLYPFCETVDNGACWSDGENKIVAQGVEPASIGDNLPDLSHISKIIVWGG